MAESRINIEKAMMRRIFILVIPALLLASIYILYAPAKSYIDEKSKANIVNNELEGTIDELEEILHDVKTMETEDFIEMEARRLGLVKPGEVPIR